MTSFDDIHIFVGSRRLRKFLHDFPQNAVQIAGLETKLQLNIILLLYNVCIYSEGSSTVPNPGTVVKHFPRSVFELHRF